MARAAVLGRLTWLVGRLAGVRDETATARTLVLDVPGWPGHLPGQHADIRLTAEDGYSTERSYSIASASDGSRIELTVERIGDGEVSPYLTQVFSPGYPLEIRADRRLLRLARGEHLAGAADRRGLGGGAADGHGQDLDRGRKQAPMRLIYSTAARAPCCTPASWRASPPAVTR